MVPETNLQHWPRTKNLYVFERECVCASKTTLVQEDKPILMKIKLLTTTCDTSGKYNYLH